MPRPHVLGSCVNELYWRVIPRPPSRVSLFEGGGYVEPFSPGIEPKLFVSKNNSSDLKTAPPIVAWPEVHDGNGGVKSSVVELGSPPGAPSGCQVGLPTVFGFPSASPAPPVPPSWMAVTGRQKLSLNFASQ